MESQDESRDSFLRVLVLKVSSLVSVSKVTGLGHMPIALRLLIPQLYGFVKLL